MNTTGSIWSTVKLFARCEVLFPAPRSGKKKRVSTWAMALKAGIVRVCVCAEAPVPEVRMRGSRYFPGTPSVRENWRQVLANGLLKSTSSFTAVCEYASSALFNFLCNEC